MIDYDFTIPKTPYPWREVEHEGELYMVRESDAAVWVSRIRDRECWLFNPASRAPLWTRTLLDIPRFPAQTDLFS